MVLQQKLTRRYEEPYPLLDAIHNVVRLGLVQLGRALERGHIAAGARLGDGEADDLLARQAVARDALAERALGKQHDRRQADAQTCTT